MICNECHARMRRGAERSVQLLGTFTSLWMSGTHGEHNTPPKRLCTRARLQKTQRAHLRVPTFKNTTKIQREDTQRERKRTKWEREREKKAKFWAVRRKGVRERRVWDGATKGGAPMGALPGLGFRSLGCRSSGLYCSGCWVLWVEKIWPKH